MKLETYPKKNRVLINENNWHTLVLYLSGTYVTNLFTEKEKYVPGEYDTNLVGDSGKTEQMNLSAFEMNGPELVLSLDKRNC